MSVFKKTDRYRENINDMIAVGKLMTKKKEMQCMFHWIIHTKQLTRMH